MQQINVNELKPHPRNNEFFDDMNGDKWKEFLDSVKSRGVIEPIVIAPDKVIVSGHQRVRACKELGITSVMCDVHTYNSEDEILQDLLETNVRQRGDVGGSAKKVGLRIRELERIYGIKNGGSGFYGNQHEELGNNFVAPKTQEELANDLGMTVRNLQNYKILSEMLPEFEDLIDTGIISQTTVLAMMKQLSSTEQEEIISSLDTTKKITQKKMQQYIDKIKQLESKKPEVQIVDKTDYSLEKKNIDLKNQITRLERDNADMKIINRNLEHSKQSVEELMESYKNESEEYTQMKQKMLELGLRPDGDYNILEISNDITNLTKDVEELLRDKLSPIRYSKSMPVITTNNALKKNVMNLLTVVNDWCNSMANAIGETLNENIVDVEMEEF